MTQGFLGQEDEEGVQETASAYGLKQTRAMVWVRELRGAVTSDKIGGEDRG